MAAAASRWRGPGRPRCSAIGPAALPADYSPDSLPALTSYKHMQDLNDKLAQRENNMMVGTCSSGNKQRLSGTLRILLPLANNCRKLQDRHHVTLKKNTYLTISTTDPPVQVGHSLRQLLQQVAADGEHLQRAQGVQVDRKGSQLVLPAYNILGLKCN